MSGRFSNKLGRVSSKLERFHRCQEEFQRCYEDSQICQEESQIGKERSSNLSGMITDRQKESVYDTFKWILTLLGSVSKTARRFSKLSERIASEGEQSPEHEEVSHTSQEVADISQSISNKPGRVSGTVPSTSHTCPEGRELKYQEGHACHRVFQIHGRGGAHYHQGESDDDKMCLENDRKCQERKDMKCVMNPLNQTGRISK